MIGKMELLMEIHQANGNPIFIILENISLKNTIINVQDVDGAKSIFILGKCH